MSVRPSAVVDIRTQAHSGYGEVRIPTGSRLYLVRFGTTARIAPIVREAARIDAGLPQSRAVMTRTSSSELWGNMAPMSYAIVWTENDGPRYTGRLDVTVDALVLTATGPGALALSELRYRDLTTAHLDRAAQAELPSEPALVLGTQQRDRVVIGSLEGVGALHELADELALAREQTRSPNQTRRERPKTMTGRRPPPPPVRT
jgi:hypothetical protein